MWGLMNRGNLSPSVKGERGARFSFVSNSYLYKTPLEVMSDPSLLYVQKPSFCMTLFSTFVSSKAKHNMTRAKNRLHVSDSSLSQCSEPGDTLSFSRSIQKYTIYTNQTKKRIAYLACGSVCALICAYRYRIALIYSLTQALHSSVSTTQDSCSKSHHQSNLELLEGPQTVFYSCKENTSLSEIDTLSVLSLVNQDRKANKEHPFDLSPSELLSEDKGPRGPQGPRDCLSLNKYIPSKETLLENMAESFRFALSDTGNSPPSTPRVDLIFTDIEEAFSTSLSICLFYFVLFTAPLLLYHLLCFLLPGLFESQARTIYLHGGIFVLVWYLFLWFIDFSLIPQLLSFFYSFQIQTNSLCLRAETKIDSYVSWCIYVNLVFSAICILSCIFVESRAIKISQSIRLVSLNRSTKTRVLCSVSSRANAFTAKGLSLLSLKRFVRFVSLDSRYLKMRHCLATVSKLFTSLKRHKQTKREKTKNVFFAFSSLFDRTQKGKQKENKDHKDYDVIPSCFFEKRKFNSFWYAKVFSKWFVFRHKPIKQKKPLNVYQPGREKIWCASFLIAACISPPDALTQFLCAFAMIVCNELIVVVSLVRAMRSYACQHTDL